MTNFINLTPHDINIVADNGDITVIPRSGSVARCASNSTPAGDHGGVPLTRVVFGAVTGLPDPAHDTLFIVSALVRAACPDRHDLASPGDLVRDDNGNIIGCRNLVIN